MILRQSTTSVVHLGPFVETDGTTLSASVALSPGLAELFKSNSTGVVDVSGRLWSHISGSIYALTLTAGDLDTLGPLQIHIHTAGVKPVLVEADVYSQPAYDACCGGGKFPADVQAVAGNGTAATRLALGASQLQPITVQNGASSSTIPSDLTQATSSFFNGRTLLMASGALAGQQVQITGYNGATKVLTVSQFTSAPVAGDQGVIV